jgi:hypothetical protein
MDGMLAWPDDRLRRVVGWKEWREG